MGVRVPPSAPRFVKRSRRSQLRLASRFTKRGVPAKLVAKRPLNEAGPSASPLAALATPPGKPFHEAWWHRICVTGRVVHPPRTVYVIESASDRRRYYIGITGDLSKRLAAHNAGESRHTSKFRPWHAVVTIDFADSARALKFERYLKSHSGRAFLSRHFR